MARHSKNASPSPSSEDASSTQASEAPESKGRHGRGRRGRSEDAPIGLTEAFAPLSDAHQKSEGDSPIGLTEAFAPVSRYDIDIDALQREARAAGFRNGQRPDATGEVKARSHAGGFNYHADDGSDEYPDALDSLEPQDEGPLLFNEEPHTAPAPIEPVGTHGKSESAEEAHPLQRKSRRVRKMLIFVIVLLIALTCALGYFIFSLFQESSVLASQQAQEQQLGQDVDAMANDTAPATDVASVVSKKTTAPDLVQLLGLTLDQAVEAIGSGATVTAQTDVDEADSPVKKNVSVALTEEPADARSGTPTVYLSLNREGIIMEAGYSAASASLGYGSLSFVDAVTNEHIVEHTLAETGVNLEDGTAVLPEDKSEYSTYDADGTTLTKESYSFSGTTEVNGKEIEWSSVLLYDYSSANASGNLGDTIRIIYAYVSDVAALNAAAEAEEQAAAEAEAQAAAEAEAPVEKAPVAAEEAPIEQAA